MFGRIEKEYTGQGLLETRQISKETQDEGELNSYLGTIGFSLFETLDFEVFEPSPKLVDDINRSLRTGHPLLITGERYLREKVARSVAYEINTREYDVFLNWFHSWKLRRGQKFNQSIYKFDHAAKRRDLEYHQLDPDNNPIRPDDFYYRPGAIICMMEMRKNDPRLKADDTEEDIVENLAMVSNECAVLEIQDVHEADPDFIVELMEFLADIHRVTIPELDKSIEYDKNDRPLIILTADEGFSLPSNYEGIIYTHQIKFTEQEDMLRSLKESYKAYINPVTRVQLHDLYDKILPVVDKMVDIFYVSKDNALLQPQDLAFPLTIPHLLDAIERKIGEICRDEEQLPIILKDLDSVLSSQQNIGKSMNLEEATESVRKLVEGAKTKDALRTLKLIRDNLPRKLQVRVSQLLATHKDILGKEHSGTESELLLVPMKNKLNADLLTLLQEIKT